MKRYICLLLLIFVIISAVLSCTAFTAQSSRVCRCADETGAYVIEFNGKHVDITRYRTDSLSVSLELSHRIYGACAHRGKAVMFCPDYGNNQTIVYIYYFDHDLLDSFAIYDLKLMNNTDFACDDDAIYIENYRDNHELLAYSYDGVLINRYRFDTEITSACGGYHNGAFIIQGDTLSVLSSDRFCDLPGAAVSTPLFPADDGVLASADGEIYCLDGNRITKTFSADTDYRASSACVIGNTVYYPCGTAVYGYDLDTGEKVSYCRFENAVALLYADADCVTAVGDDIFATVRRDEFISLRRSDVDDGSRDEDSAPGSSPHRDNSAVHTLSEITSDIYRIDYEQFQICGISPGTTIAAFKNNVHYDGYSLTLYRDNAVKKSGNIGTAMTAVFSSDNGSASFELSVTGDLTSEGSCNTRDLNILLDYLIGSADFNGVYTIAADINDDGVINVADAALLKRIIG